MKIPLEDILDYGVDADGNVSLSLKGDWLENIDDGTILKDTQGIKSVTVDAANLGKWKTPLMIFLSRLDKE